jgi:hypothetical protein
MSCPAIPVIRAGDRTNNLVAILADKTIDSDKVVTYAAKDLSAAGVTVTAYIHEKDDEETTLFSVSCTITDATIGEVEMPWPASWEDNLPDGDDTDDKFDIHFVVNDGSADTTTDYPKSIRVLPKITA